MNSVTPPPGSVTGLAPVITQSTADFTITSAGGAAWVDLDTAGSAAARPMDIVIPNAAAGKWVRVEASGLWSNEATAPALDLFTVVAGAPVTQLGDATRGQTNWVALASTYSHIQGSVSYQIVAGDIENGSVRLRPRYRLASGVNKTLFGSTIGYRFRLVGTGPF